MYSVCIDSTCSNKDMATPDFSQYPYFFQQQHRVESTPMSARNLRPARSFRSRAKAHGIRNVPPTPSLSHGGRDVTFDFEKNGGEEEGGTAEAAPVLWVKCRVSSVSSSEILIFRLQMPHPMNLLQFPFAIHLLLDHNCHHCHHDFCSC